MGCENWNKITSAVTPIKERNSKGECIINMNLTYSCSLYITSTTSAVRHHYSGKNQLPIRKIKEIIKTIFTLSWPYRLVRFGLAALFIYGGVVKLLDPKGFASIISSYDLIPEPLLPLVAIGLPLVEALAGVGLLFDIRGSLAVIGSLLGLFVFVLGYGILNDLNVDCGCFMAEEIAQQESLRLAFYRDLVLVGIIIPFLYTSRWIRSRINPIQEKFHDNGPNV